MAVNELEYPISKLDPNDLTRASDVLYKHLGVTYTRDGFGINEFSFLVSLTLLDEKTQEDVPNEKALVFEIHDFVEFGNLIDPNDKDKRITRKGIVYNIQDIRLEDGTNIRKVTGFGLGYMLKGAPIEPPSVAQVYSDSHKVFTNIPLTDVLGELVDDNRVSNVYDTNMNIANLVISVTPGIGPLLNEQFRWQELTKEIKRICSNNGYGWSVEYDEIGDEFEFNVSSGFDRTAGQSINTRAIFSIELENVKSLKRTQNFTNYRQVAKVGGQGDGIARDIVETADAIMGWLRKKIFIDARDINLGEFGDLINRGNERLNDYVPTDVIETGGFISRDNLVYLRDFDLLDTITIEDDILGISEDLQITKVVESYLNDEEFKTTLFFGLEQTTSADIINNRFKNTSVEVLK